MRHHGRFQGLRLADGPLREFVRIALFPVLFVGIVWISLNLFAVFDPVQVGLFVFFATIPLFFVLERMLPWSERWLGSQGDVHVDVGLTALAGVVAPLVEATTQLSAIAIAGWVGGRGIAQLWPAEWPLLAQAVLALVVADFFRYWVHRALHEVPLLWRVHATHHSAVRLYFFNGARIHPIEVLVSGCIENIPLLLLGVPAEALALRFVMGRVIGRFQHCNLDVRLGPLDYLFSSPLNHRWHHSRDLREAAHNYGGDVIIWDHVFRTFYLPAGRVPSDKIGIGGMPDFPSGLWPLLASPFQWKRYGAP